MCFLFTILIGVTNNAVEGTQQSHADEVVEVVMSHFRQSHPPNPLALLALTIVRMIEGSDKEKKYQLKKASKRVLIRMCGLFWPQQSDEKKFVQRLSQLLPAFMIQYLLDMNEDGDIVFAALFSECTPLLRNSDLLDAFFTTLSAHLPREGKKKQKAENSSGDGMEFASSLRILAEVLSSRPLREQISESDRLNRIEKTVNFIASKKFSSDVIQAATQKIVSAFRLLKMT